MRPEHAFQNATCSAPIDLSPVASTYNRLCELQSELSDRLGHLEDRLGAALRPIPPDDARGGTPLGELPQSDLHGMALNAALATEGHKRRVDALIQRLTI